LNISIINGLKRAWMALAHGFSKVRAQINLGLLSKEKKLGLDSC
jgi:hypothetical protein